MESRPPGTPGPPASSPDSQRRSALLLLLVGILAVVAAVLLALRDGAPSGVANSPHGEAAANWTPAERPQGETVAMVIDFGNGARRQFAALPWTAGMTVGDLLRNAQQFKPAISFEHDGAGAKAFLTSLDGVANEGPGGRFWTYEINGQFAAASFDVAPLQPGDRVLWKFAPAE